MRSRSLFLASFLVPLALAGCDGSPPQSGTIPEQLEALAVTFPSSPPQTGGLVEVSGAIKIEGAARAFKLSVDGEKPLAFDLHSPGDSPLDLLDGKTAKVALTPEGEGGRSVIVSDDTGALYIASFGDRQSVGEVDKVVGANVIRYGEEVGREGDGTFVWVYKKAVIASDDGDVAFLPGEVKVVKLKGVAYRVVFSAAYQVETDPDADALPACSPADMLGVEILRLPAEHTVPALVLTRPLEKEVAFAGCTPPGGYADE